MTVTVRDHLTLKTGPSHNNNCQTSREIELVSSRFKQARRDGQTEIDAGACVQYLIPPFLMWLATQSIFLHYGYK